MPLPVTSPVHLGCSWQTQPENFGIRQLGQHAPVENDDLWISMRWKRKKQKVHSPICFCHPISTGGRMNWSIKASRKRNYGNIVFLSNGYRGQTDQTVPKVKKIFHPLHLRVFPFSSSTPQTSSPNIHQIKTRETTVHSALALEGRSINTTVPFKVPKKSSAWKNIGFSAGPRMGFCWVGPPMCFSPPFSSFWVRFHAKWRNFLKLFRNDWMIKSEEKTWKTPFSQHYMTWQTVQSTAKSWAPIESETSEQFLGQDQQKQLERILDRGHHGLSVPAPTPVPSPCINPSADWSKQRVRPEREAIPASCVGGAELVTLKRTNPSTS